MLQIGGASVVSAAKEHQGVGAVCSGDKIRRSKGYGPFGRSERLVITPCKQRMPCIGAEHARRRLPGFALALRFGLLYSPGQCILQFCRLGVLPVVERLFDSDLTLILGWRVQNFYCLLQGRRPFLLLRGELPLSVEPPGDLQRFP
jgi:hypothetical protein